MQIQISWLLQKSNDLGLFFFAKAGHIRVQLDQGYNFKHIPYLFAYFLPYFQMAISVDPDQTVSLGHSDLGLHCLHMPFCQRSWYPNFSEQILTFQSGPNSEGSKHSVNTVASLKKYQFPLNKRF